MLSTKSDGDPTPAQEARLDAVDSAYEAQKGRPRTLDRPVNVNLKMPRALHVACHVAARQDGRSFSDWLRRLAEKEIG